MEIISYHIPDEESYDDFTIPMPRVSRMHRKRVAKVRKMRAVHQRECGWYGRVQEGEGIPKYDANDDKHCNKRGGPQAKRGLPDDMVMQRMRPSDGGSLSNAIGAGGSTFSNPFVSIDSVPPPVLLDQQNMSQSASVPGFSSVAATFDFQHHEGSDAGRELHALKFILLREGYISRLRDLVAEISNGMNPVLKASGGTGVLDLLMDVREASLGVVESIVRWREGFKGDSLPPPFSWQGINYLVKMTTDMDFLAGCEPLTSTLNVPPESMCRNPLMMPTTLDDRLAVEKKAWETGETPESDTPPASELDREQAEKRERMRRAELVLLQEDRLARGDPLFIGGDSHSPTAAATYGGYGSIDGVATSGQAMRLDPLGNVNSESVLRNWHEEAIAQLERLSQPIDGHPVTRSTNRLNVPKRSGVFNPMPLTSHDGAAALRAVSPSSASVANHGIGPAPAELVAPVKLTSLIVDGGGGGELDGNYHRAAGSFYSQPYTNDEMPSVLDLGSMDSYDIDGNGMQRLPIASSKLARKRLPQGPQNVKARYLEPRKPKGTPRLEQMQREKEKQRRVVRRKVRKKKHRLARNEGLGNPVPAVASLHDPTGRDAANAEYEAMRRADGENADRGEAPALDNAAQVAHSITADDLRGLAAIDQPPQAVALVCATALIVLTPGEQVPSNVSWPAVREQFADVETLLARLQTFDPITVPQFKIRALQPFLLNGTFRPHSLKVVSLSAAKICAWVLQVVRCQPQFEEWVEERKKALADEESAKSRSSAWFRQLDVGENGKISARELKRALQALEMKSKRGAVQRVIEQLESDDDKEIDVQEFRDNMSSELRAAITVSVDADGRIIPTQDRRFMAWFNEFDADGSGKISRREMKAALRKLGLKNKKGVLNDLMQGMDTDGDGEIDLDEFVSNMPDGVRAAIEASVDAKGAIVSMKERNGDAAKDEQSSAALQLQKNVRQRQARSQVSTKRREGKAAVAIQKRARSREAKTRVNEKRRQQQKKKSQPPPPAVVGQVMPDAAELIHSGLASVRGVAGNVFVSTFEIGDKVTVKLYDPTSATEFCLSLAKEAASKHFQRGQSLSDWARDTLPGLVSVDTTARASEPSLKLLSPAPAAVSKLALDTVGDPASEDSTLQPMNAEEHNLTAQQRATQGWFEQFDADGNGKISASEMKKALQKLGMKNKSSAVKAMVSKLDRDGDGQIDLSEFSTNMTDELREAIESSLNAAGDIVSMKKRLASAEKDDDQAVAALKLQSKARQRQARAKVQSVRDDKAESDKEAPSADAEKQQQSEEVVVEAEKEEKKEKKEKKEEAKVEVQVAKPSDAAKEEKESVSAADRPMTANTNYSEDEYGDDDFDELSQTASPKKTASAAPQTPTTAVVEEKAETEDNNGRSTTPGGTVIHRSGHKLGGRFAMVTVASDGEGDTQEEDGVVVSALLLSDDTEVTLSVSQKEAESKLPPQSPSVGTRESAKLLADQLQLEDSATDSSKQQLVLEGRTVTAAETAAAEEPAAAAETAAAEETVATTETAEKKADDVPKTPEAPAPKTPVAADEDEYEDEDDDYADESFSAETPKAQTPKVAAPVPAPAPAEEARPETAESGYSVDFDEDEDDA